MASAADPNSRPAWQFQFKLRTLLLAVTAIGAMLAFVQAVGAMGAIAVAFVLTMMLLHVAGNAIGTRLRDDATRQIEDQPEEQPAHGTAAEPAALNAGRLGERTPLGWLIVALTLLAAGVGAYLGWLVFAHQPTASGTIVGVASSTVLGGFFGFLSSCFAKTVLTAWWEARRV
jgi:hypothetical protein